MTPADPKLCHLRAKRLLDEVVRPSIYTDRQALAVEVYQCVNPISYADAVRQSYRPVDIGFIWGPIWSTAWFRLSGQVPEDLGKEFRLLFDTRTEALCWWDGVPYQGVELHRQDIKLPPTVVAGSELKVYIEAACNHMLGVGPDYGDFARQQEFPRTQSGRLTLAHVARFHPHRAALATELQTLINLAQAMPADSSLARQADNTLAEVVSLIRAEHLDETLPAARERIDRALRSGAAGTATTAHCVGNAHIDLAWLWPIRETKRKASRTFSTVLRYMERWPGYHFLQSQAQLYEWVRQDYPALFQQIQDRVREGRWEVGGAAWVEPDCNLPSGESLVRQFLLGTRFFEKHFGIKQTYFWQPDVFGYSAALPQILRLSGLDTFFSQKISWNQYNRFPHHTFKWVGIDGTSVLSHFLPADTYIGSNLPFELRHGEENYRQSAKCPAWLQAYGWGDGGGGPTEDQIARIDLLADCAGLPRARHSRVDEFIAKIRHDEAALPLWYGELYLELHRGTYTSQAVVKKNNRLCERLLQDVEVMQSLAILSGRPRSEEQAREIDRLWKLVLLNQFHDILPGSSIGWVYRDAMQDYQAVQSGAAALLTGAVRTSTAETWSVLNTSGRRRSELVILPADLEAKALKLQNDHGIAVQETRSLSGESERIAIIPDVSRLSATTVHVAEKPAQAAKLLVDDLVLQNDHLHVVLDEAGRVTSLIDRVTGRDAIRPGEFANQLILFEDLPGNHDAWDIDLAYADKPVKITDAAEHVIVEHGPVRAAIEFRRSIGKRSRLIQRVQLTANGKFVEFATRVEWHESHQFLRVEHAVDVLADYATYEIQFGHVRRPNHFNTSWDYARFEVPAQRWMDLSESGFGVTLINDCKYGHSCLGNVMGLSLLRSTKSPDPDADMGTHEFRYALLPHGSFDPAAAVAAAESLNQPLRILRGHSDLASLIVSAPVEDHGIVIDSVKPAEDGHGLIIRLYECRGGRTALNLEFAAAVTGVQEVDLMERPISSLTSRAAFCAKLRPFQILSLRLLLW
jgi:alpha-mannosidase